MSAAPAGTRCCVHTLHGRSMRCSVLLSVITILLLMTLVLLSASPSLLAETSTKVLLPSAKIRLSLPQDGNDPFNNYVSVLKRVSCEPVIVSSGDSVDLDSIDGVLLPGGADINSAVLNQKPFDRPTWTDPKFDRFELDIIKKAWEKDMPILTICRGAQILNVSRGGTLYGDLPSERGFQNGVWHRDPQTKKETHHVITITPGTLLYQILEKPVKIVNSHHHHAVKNFGEGLTMDAVAPDGVIEAFHAPDRTFCLGIQFHPERLIIDDKLFLNIFQRFHEETVKYRNAREK